MREVLVPEIEEGKDAERRHGEGEKQGVLAGVSGGIAVSRYMKLVSNILKEVEGNASHKNLTNLSQTHALARYSAFDDALLLSQNRAVVAKPICLKNL